MRARDGRAGRADPARPSAQGQHRAHAPRHREGRHPRLHRAAARPIASASSSSARAAYVLSPPTLDYALLTSLVVARWSSTSSTATGTAIGDAVGTAVARLRRSDARSKAIILLTDGDSNAGIDRARVRGAPRADGRRVRSTPCRSATATRSTSRTASISSASRTTCAQHFPVNPELLQKHGARRPAASRSSRPTAGRSRRACTRSSTTSRRRASRRRRRRSRISSRSSSCPAVVARRARRAACALLARAEVPVRFAYDFTACRYSSSRRVLLRSSRASPGCSSLASLRAARAASRASAIRSCVAKLESRSTRAGGAR